MPTIPTRGKPLVNELETFFEPTDVVAEKKKAQRMAMSQKARTHRSVVKTLKERRSTKQ